MARSAVMDTPRCGVVGVGVVFGVGGRGEDVVMRIGTQQHHLLVCFVSLSSFIAQWYGHKDCRYIYIYIYLTKFLLSRSSFLSD